MPPIPGSTISFLRNKNVSNVAFLRLCQNIKHETNCSSPINSRRSYHVVFVAPSTALRNKVPRNLRGPSLQHRHHSTRADHSKADSTANGTGASSSASGVFPTDQDANLGPLNGLVEELDAIAPRFEIDDIESDDGSTRNKRDGIDVIEGPANFYDVLKAKILKAERRIYLSTLYIGKTEHELISTIRAALQVNPRLTISFLADALRGTRETPRPTTASLLAPLITEFGPERVKIRMFHTPNLTGLKKRVLPQRINEGWGLQHMKLYGIDDEIILSGANLSEDYFTNRLDRYHLISSKGLTDYYERIHEAISNMSFDIQPDADNEAGYLMTWPATNKGPNPLEDSKRYMSYGSEILQPLISPASNMAGPAHSRGTPSASRTYVYPIFQLTPILTKPAADQSRHQSTELPAITKLLLALRSKPFAPAQLTFTAGYFNPSPSLVRLLLDTQQQQKITPASATNAGSPKLDVIAASPYANGFYGSKGISAMLPPAYTLLCRRFLEEAQRRGIAKQGAAAPGSTGSVTLREWRRGTVGQDGGWTYHAKGLWVTLPGASSPAEPGGGQAEGEAGPAVTLIGSSNYTQRSYELDLEAGALILTRNPRLQARLREEVGWLGRDAEQMSLDDYQRTERRVGVGVRLAMWIVRVVGGAL